MKGLVLPLFACVVLIEAASGQERGSTIFESLALVRTNFEITLEGRKLEVPVQGITLRAVYHPFDERARNSRDAVIGGAAGYRAYHLEFVYSRDTIDWRVHTIVELYSGPDVVYRYSIKEMPRYMTNAPDKREQLKVFAISFEGVPLVVLDYVDRIEIREPGRDDIGVPIYTK